MQEFDLAIVGGGPAGMSAAIYASRRAMKTVLLEEKTLGGMLNEIREVDNYLGFSKATGPQLLKAFSGHLATFSVEVKEFEAVEAIRKEGNKFVISSSGGDTVAKAVLVATGMKHSGLGVEGESRLLGRGVSYCATCDAPFFKGKKVVVAGGGDSAISAALYLCDVASKVYVVHRSEFRAVEVMIQKLREKEKEGKAEIILGKSIVGLKGEKTLSSIVLEDASGTKSELAADAVFVYAGGVPLNALAQGLGVKLNERGFIACDEEGKTSVPGVFAAGDVTGKGMQIITAASAGALAALAAYKHVKQLTR
ncbi:FAD-dependent oxidoreductase [Candidatus Micrarchaeota archaeon]|nr:FAD-dependent oxidoreductase [Candidatus Micrarchaeota archaeon]